MTADDEHDFLDEEREGRTAPVVGFALVVGFFAGVATTGLAYLIVRALGVMYGLVSP